ncbi:zinc-dependent metalloprotease [Ferruginibacter sp. SUN106]|uniref:zinc-dependent metalloprotease n=1 Tax=Ferruginibacter sp. SUN106 TaxID=2978348 RepID=UPI003D35EAB7
MRFNYCNKKICLALLAQSFAFFVTAQDKPAMPPTTAPGMPPAAAKAGPKPYKEVITDKAKTSKGLFTVHKVEDKYYFELPPRLLGRDILIINRVSKSSVESPKQFNGYAGDEIGNNVIRFEKGPNNKIFLKNISYNVNPDSTKPMFRSVMNSNVQPIAMAFDIKANASDSAGGGIVIDITDNITADNEIFGFASFAKSSFQVGGFQPDKSYIVSVRPYATNIEITTVKTFSKSAGAPMPGFAPSAPSQATVTLEMNSSLLILPEKPMKPRYEDNRVGFFSTGFTDFDANPQGVKDINMIARWRLEPKPEDMEKYKRGELVEPAKPIVYYIDPSTPKKWVPYLIQGINDWQVAFEKAGFKNAIMGKEAPTKEQDSTWSLEDARNSAIIYKPSPIENAYGPSTTDPRSGEIMESHIGWFHNVMKLLHDWYMIQAGAIDPKARKMVFDDELMGQLIRFVSSHEVGHTLGLPHNFGSSAGVPVENLRNKAWVEANGHTPSIMDYARFNYVAQPEDNITAAGIYPRIGDYDKWAIEWGYKMIPEAATAEDEVPILDKWIEAKANDKRFYYGRQGQPDDPRDQSECIGDNAMKASTYGIKNLQRILPNLISWTKQPNDDYGDLSNMYDQLTTQFRRYIGHVCYNFGGVYETLKKNNQAGNVYEYVSKETQKEAADFINKQVFTTPTWLINKDITSKTGGNPTATILSLQETALGRMLSTTTMTKMLNAEASIGSQAYTVNDLLGDLKQSIFTELSTKKPIDIYRRNLQKSYVERLGALINPAPQQGIVINFGNGPAPSVDTKKSDVLSYLKGNARELKAAIDAAAAGTTDKATKYHLQDLSDRLKKILDPK